MRVTRALRTRLAATIAAGGYGGVLAWALAARPGFLGDHLAWWFGARVLLAGGNPYATLPSGPPYHIADPLFYPLTALVAAVPFTPFPLALSHALFVALGSALLGWGLAPRGWLHLALVLLSFPFLMAANLGQWSPYIAAAALTPALGWLVACKPNLGLAAMAWRPSWAMIAGGAAFAALTLLVMPSWPLEWLASVRSGHAHPSPLRTLLGLPVLLALLRWRSADARLVIAMAALPQTALFADQLLLFLVPKSRRELMFLAFTSIVGGLLFTLHLRGSTDPARLLDLRYVMLAMYWPAVAIILARRDAVARDAEPPDARPRPPAP